MRCSWLVCTFFVTLAACGSDSTPTPTCTAGTTNACLCAGGASGVQTCNTAGSGYGICECGSPTDGGVPDAGRFCTPGESQDCACAAGETGWQECNSAGSAYGTCECTATTCTVASTDGRTFTDSCGATEICVCPGGVATCANGRCGSISGRSFRFEFYGYAAPRLDAGGNCWDDVFNPCDDAPDVAVASVIGGVSYPIVQAVDTPILTGDTWSGNFDGVGFTGSVGMSRGYAFVWTDVDTDANDPIGEATGALSDAVLRNRALDIGPANSGFVVAAIPQ